MAMDDDHLPKSALDATTDQGAVASPGGSDSKENQDPLGFLDVAAKRAFSESEVSQAITIRFIVERIREQKREIDQLRPFEKRSYELERDLEIERGKAKLTKVQEVVSLALTTIGGVGIGLALKFWDTNPNTAIAGFVLSAEIVATGVYLKVASR